MLKEEFNINVLSDDAIFCTSLATECNKFGFLLSFFDKKDALSKGGLLYGDFLSVAIIDLDSDNLDIIKHIRKTSKMPVFGVCNKINKSLQSRSKKEGYDLIFTKSLLINSIKRIIIHIANETGNE